MSVIRCSLLLTLAMLLAQAAQADELKFRAQELPTRLGVGYAVRLLDMNGDKRDDIIIVDQQRVLWLENPTWAEHVILKGQTEPDNVCIAPYDINDDGRLDFAIGAAWSLNTTRGGTIQWIEQGESPADPWKLHPIGAEPTTHRMRFADLDADGRKELIVVPLLGRNTTRPDYKQRGVRILSYKIPADPENGPWKPKVINDDLHVSHNFLPVHLTSPERLDLLVVSFEGVNLLERHDGGRWSRALIGRGNQKTSPNRGASEIKLGHLRDKKEYIATIEPWHGHQVVVYTREKGAPPQVIWRRNVIDEQLKWGHAVWCANLDSDPDEELIIGVRDNHSDRVRCGLLLFDPQDGEGKDWRRTTIDPGGVAIEDLAVADMNADGRLDIVAVGRQSHNVKIYWNETGKK
jgi:hypothetical protein